MIPEFKQFSFRDLQEVITLHNSRAFGIEINEKPTTVLAPYADMFNHKFPKDTTWFYDDDTHGLKVVALEDIPKG
jgi:protein-histidine N-methyltransferase